MRQTKGLTTEELIKEIRSGLEKLEDGLPTDLDASAVSETAKLPFKALSIRAVLAWRFVDISCSVMRCVDEDRTASAAVLTRAALETGAAVWYLNDRLRRALDTGAVGNTDDCLMKLLLGSRTMQEVLPSAINVLTFVDAVNKQVDGVRHQYDELSELAHPNWAGAMNLYCTTNHDERAFSFGPQDEVTTKTNGKIFAVLSGTILIFKYVFEEIDQAMPEFVQLCEREIALQKNEKP